MIAACRAAGIDAAGKWRIHPSQVPLTNSVFAPSPKEIEQAQKIVDLYNEAAAKGAGVAGKGGRWVDAATLRTHEPVLERAKATGRLWPWRSGKAPRNRPPVRHARDSLSAPLRARRPSLPSVS